MRTLLHPHCRTPGRPHAKPFVPLVDRVGEPWQRLVVALAGLALCGRVGCGARRSARGVPPGTTTATEDGASDTYDSAFRGGYFRQNWDRFHVYVVAQGIPAYRSYDMHVNVFATGAVRFHY